MSPSSPIPTNINAVSYERVSSDEQAREGFSLEVQNEKNTQHIRAEGWTLFDVYVDPGKSGKNLKRPDMQRLLVDLKAKKFQVIVIHKLDRLTRNIGDLHYLLSLFDEYEIKLVSISEKLDTTSAMGRMFVYMLGIFAQWYRENLSEEVTKGQSKRAEKGMRNTSAKPYGYNVGENLELTVNPEEARIVQMIYEWYISGYGRNKIATILNTELKIPAPRGGKWKDKIIGDIIGNITHTGATHWKRKADPEENRIIVPNQHEPIIARDLFERAQSIKLRRREHDISQSSYDFAFSTIVKCGECGRSYHGKQKTIVRWGSLTRHYRCSGKYRQDSCDASDISEIKLTDLFLQFIKDFTFDTVEPQKEITGKEAAKEKKRLEKMIADSAVRRKNYSRAMADGKLPYNDFVELMDEENAKVNQWQADLDMLNAVTPNQKRTRREVLASIEELSASWTEWTDETRKQSLSRIFNALVIMKRNNEWKIVAFQLNE